jgi:thymidylate synthase (FAD)
LHFLVNVDQATHIHLLKHRIGVSINGESARYKELKEDKTYIPEDWLLGHESSTEDGILTHWADTLATQSAVMNKLYHQCLEDLSPILGRKRAKESARFFKTMNSQITMDISFNFRSFAHFQGLRNSEHAQVEVRELAQQMLELVKTIEGNPFEQTIKAFKL